MALAGHDRDDMPVSRWLPSPRWLWTGAALLVSHVILLLLSPQFNPNHPLQERPVLLLVGLEVIVGVTWLFAVWPPVPLSRTHHSTAYMVLIGVLLRVVMLFSTPVLEDDFWRYLWDGAVVAVGHNPYVHPPEDFLPTNPDALENIPFTLQGLAEDGRDVLSRINHPHLRTIYPPGSLAAFAVAYAVAPWNVLALRMVLLTADAAVLILLLCLLREFGLPPLWAMVYWWNPLLIQECVNAAHMDVLALPFVLGALLLAVRGKHVTGIAVLSCAVGIKLWPVILLPFLFRPLLRSPRKLGFGALTAGAIGLVLIWPAVHALQGAGSGAAAYASRWEMNDALFMAFQWGVRMALSLMNTAQHAPLVTRMLVFLLLSAWVARLAWFPVDNTSPELARRMLLAVAGLFLLSPTQFPWYSLWFLPLLALNPRPSLLLLTVLLPLYRLRFYFVAREQASLFDNGIVWLEYLPVWGCLLWETLKHPHAGRRPPQPNARLSQKEAETS
ncbi:MAG: hypothetical protein HN742_04900 [Lentisphaerae bacterium]|jgi:alpha-1,6-mannosyltransferase|nr:hypothetical protein [Lentisphaerota bacterium]MBT4823280.1 hypothetical protein [Lentisphaerota bacterium]MBT5610845.1 hypothetical protein [Lentisphaerota bacterium]MBT7053723.1 hypothetical protein [Lentisphaerota bacterium]MBT7841184.1 hypothetical protein [Lentisphaerota bacterium]